MRILWLVSWYPNKLSPFNGDFIKRHAEAVSLFGDLHVIYVVRDIKGAVTKNVLKEQTVSGKLKETIIYYYTPESPVLFTKFFAEIKYRQLFRQAIREYILEKGTPDLAHVHVLMKAGIVALWIKRKFSIPYIFTEHWGIYNNLVADQYRTRSFLFKIITRKIVKNASGFLSVSRYIAEGISQMVTKCAYKVIPNTVDTDLFSFTPRGIGSKLRFIHVSNMDALKNAEGILRSFAKIKQLVADTELHFVGKHSLKLFEYANLVIPGGDDVFFHGEVPYFEVARQMQQSDCFILFSNIENSPCVIGEALCCGLPVISTNVGGIPELLNSQNSILIKPGDEDALVHAMLEIDRSKERFNREEIAKIAFAHFSYTAVGRSFCDYYMNLINGGVRI